MYTERDHVVQLPRQIPQPLQTQEMLVAFMGGFFSLFVGLVGFRAFAAMAKSRSLRAHTDPRGSAIVLEDPEERCAADPMLGGA
jgi:hypothetical protein